jgi:tRNA-dihydrouridine synthase B
VCYFDLIMKNIWQKLKEEKKDKPILCLAPMADVTDRAFRQIIAKYSKNNKNKFEQNRYVTWTEFVSADGLFLGGYDALINDLSFTESERPIIAQFFTSKPEMMEKASRLAVELGFDGIDINMGCPDKSVEKQGAGASLIKNPNLAKEIILAAKQGAQRPHSQKDFKGEISAIPVSVKTRIGYNKNELEEWLPNLLETEPSVITIHARTRREMSLVPAKWENVKRGVEIRDTIYESREKKTLIFGNGDVVDIPDAQMKAKETGCDGVMLGRAVFGNPWLFSNHKPNTEEKLKVLIEHSKLFEELVQPKPISEQARLFGGHVCLPAPEVVHNGGQARLFGGQGKSFAVMKKHFKAYVEGFTGAKELRIKLMEANNAEEVSKTILDFLNK